MSCNANHDDTILCMATNEAMHDSCKQHNADVQPAPSHWASQPCVPSAKKSATFDSASASVFWSSPLRRKQMATASTSAIIGELFSNDVRRSLRAHSRRVAYTGQSECIVDILDTPTTTMLLIIFMRKK